MRENRDVKVESSIPVQTRVSIVSLAKLMNYWELSGYPMKTMSQLLAWSIDLLIEVLVANNAMNDNIDTIEKAYQLLRMRGVLQKSLKNRALKKIHASLSFESLRQEGIDPRNYVPQQYNTLHRNTSVKPYQGTVSTGKFSDGIDEAFERLDEENRKDRKETIQADIEKAKESGLVIEKGLREDMSDEEIDEYERKREDEQLKLINQDLTEEDMKRLIVKDK